MRKFVHKLRERPEHERKQILFVSTVVMSLIAIFFWVSLFHVEYGDAKVAGTLKTQFTPLASIKDGAMSLYKSLSAGVENSTSYKADEPVTKTDDGAVVLHPENPEQ